MELQLIETEGAIGSEKRSYNECLVQMGSAQDAKKCLNSPTAVVNNRFVKLMYSTFNIVDYADVLPPTADELAPPGPSGPSTGPTGYTGHSGSAATAKETALPSAVNAVRKTKKWVNEDAPPVKEKVEVDPRVAVERRVRGVGQHGRGFGVSNKFVASHISGIPSAAAGVTSAVTSAVTSSPSGGSSSSVADVVDGGDVGDEDPLYSGLQLNKSDSPSQSQPSSSSSTSSSSIPLTPAADATTPTTAAAATAAGSVSVAVSVPLTKEDLALQVQYEGLRALRQQADTIWKQKESLLQVTYRQYIFLIFYIFKICLFYFSYFFSIGIFYFFYPFFIVYFLFFYCFPIITRNFSLPKTGSNRSISNNAGETGILCR